MPRLTDIKIRAARPSSQDVLLADGSCLFLRVRPSGSRGWIVRIKRNGKRRVHTLGPWPGVTIKEARAEAARIVAVDRGTARVSVAEAVEQFMDLQIRPRYRHLGNTQGYCNTVKAALGALAVDAVRPVDISRMVVAHKRRGPIAALRLLSFTKQFFSWIVGFGYVDRSPGADVKSSAFGIEEEPRARILTDDEIRAIWRADLPQVPLLRFLLLTGLRLQEAQRAQASDIDADNWLTIPAEHAKNGKEHRVYLTPLARKQFDNIKALTPSTVQWALRRWQDRHGFARWTPHDLRRTFASRCGDIGVAPHVIAKLLNHTIPGAASLPVYLRSEWLDERKQAALQLAKHIAGIVKVKP